MHNINSMVVAGHRISSDYVYSCYANTRPHFQNKYFPSSFASIAQRWRVYSAARSSAIRQERALLEEGKKREANFFPISDFPTQISTNFIYIIGRIFASIRSPNLPL